MQELLIVACRLLGLLFHLSLYSCRLTFECRNCTVGRALVHWD
jgi:hypothetical protein